MPFAGLQSVVNGWIKLSNKNSASGRNEDGLDSSHHPLKKTPQNHEGDTAIGGSDKGKDPEIRAIRRYNNRKKNRSKLERSVSLTDLLRQMANEKEEGLKHQAVNNSKNQSESGGSAQEARTAPPQAQEHQANEIEVDECQVPLDIPADEDDDGSFRFVNGFFGTDIPPPPPPPPPVPAVQPPDQRMSQQQHERRLYAPDGSPRMIIRPLLTDSMSKCSKEDEIASMRGTPPLYPIASAATRDNDGRSRHSSNPMQQFFMNFPHANIGNKRCGSCEEMESRLVAMQSDMEYLRSAALRNEYATKASQMNAAVANAEQEALSLQASRRLADTEARYIAQVQQLTKERSKLQESMHFKLAKFATIAKDLNEESALRKYEAIHLEDELMTVKAERDALALEVQHLRTTVSQNKLKQEEHAALKQKMQEYELHGLARSKETTDQRDDVIRSLSLRLENTLEALEKERSQRRQRRQIIFPSRASYPISMHQSSYPIHAQPPLQPTPQNASQMNRELELAKKEVQMSDMRLALAQSESARAEAVYRARIESLEQQLDHIMHNSGTP